MPGGDTGRRMFRCGFHIDCPVKVRLLAKDGQVVRQKLLGVNHGTDIDEYDRANAPLTREQKREVKTSMRYGGSAGDAMRETQKQAVSAGAKISDDVGVQGVLPSSP